MRTIALAVAVALGALVTLASPGSSEASQRACSSYPTPGTLAPANVAVPRSVSTRYAILRTPQNKADRLRPRQLTASLTASGVIMSGIRLLGDVAFGGRIYLVPAQHLLEFRLAPARCLPPAQRSLQRTLLPQLRSEYAHTALCLVMVRASTTTPSCGSASGRSVALQTASGTPGFGLVPDGVSAVTMSYLTAPPRTVEVHHNFFAIIAPAQSAAPCGLQWLDPTGTVIKTVTGCSFIAQETQSLDEYRDYVAGKLATLQSQVAALITAINSGKLAQAQEAWLTAHETWLDIGQDDGAYGCFGELGREIDGTTAGLPTGTASPDFTGFHKIELDLWTNQNLAAAATDADELKSIVAQLVAIPLASELPATKTGIGNWVLRPHEILEDANRDTLTAQDDYGSGTGLASLTADIAATNELLNLLAPIIDPLAPRLVGRARDQLDALNAAIQATRSGGNWIAIQNLPTSQREQIDADTGAVLETVAPIPDLVTSTGNNAPPT